MESLEALDTKIKNERFVARYYGVSLGTVRRWRFLKQGPPYRKIGNLVRYAVSDLETWWSALPAGGQGQSGEAKTSFATNEARSIEREEICRA